MKTLTREWLEYAEHDLYAAKLLAESHKPPFEVIAYHCQQSAEKIQELVNQYLTESST